MCPVQCTTMYSAPPFDQLHVRSKSRRRYTWRHDSVLQDIERVLLTLLLSTTRSQAVLRKSQRKTSRQVLCAQVNEENQTQTIRKSGAACLNLLMTGNFKSISKTAC